MKNLHRDHRVVTEYTEEFMTAQLDRIALYTCRLRPDERKYSDRNYV